MENNMTANIHIKTILNDIDVSNQEEAGKLLTKMDTNGDKAISVEEFRKAYTGSDGSVLFIDKDSDVTDAMKFLGVSYYGPTENPIEHKKYQDALPQMTLWQPLSDVIQNHFTDVDGDYEYVLVAGAAKNFSQGSRSSERETKNKPLDTQDNMGKFAIGGMILEDQLIDILSILENDVSDDLLEYIDFNDINNFGYKMNTESGEVEIWYGNGDALVELFLSMQTVHDEKAKVEVIINGEEGKVFPFVTSAALTETSQALSISKGAGPMIVPSCTLDD